MIMSNLDLKKACKELGIKFPIADMSKNLNYSKGMVSDYYNGKKEVSAKFSEAFIEHYNYKSSISSLPRIEEDKINTYKNKVPLYETDVTSHVTTSFNDIPEIPSYYVDYKPFNDCTAYVKNYGDSMFPKYKNGEKLAVKQINNLDVITWGETYLVVTNGNANDLRTVKDVHPHKDESKIILRASNPNYAGDTVINKEDILSMFAVKGKISQNFI